VVPTFDTVRDLTRPAAVQRVPELSQPVLDLSIYDRLLDRVRWRMADRQTELRLMLRRLKLPAIAALFEDLALKAVKANLGHEAFLYELVRSECLQRDEHRIAHLQRISGLPPDKTFAPYYSIASQR
jgi:hypothetical protein